MTIQDHNTASLPGLQKIWKPNVGSNARLPSEKPTDTEVKIARSSTPASTRANDTAFMAAERTDPSSTITCTIIDITVLGYKVESMYPENASLNISSRWRSIFA